ncbi:GNAT family N-acetyltransferase [Cecembia sp.]|uniref:GNAT family N-acetyltransferase n=1 Tax=Cecembia sp. TaxID=1898110 RepID=UPI0025BE8720|nr:GNAT family N-acetyltransferase [Cecembia sp.]
MIIQNNDPSCFPELLEIWEASVRATHDFLNEDKIQEIRQIIIDGNVFAHADIYTFQNAEKKILGFLGLSKEKIEMLFIHPDFRGQGIGKNLTNFAVNERKILKVEVNEQNIQAVNFYKKLGFHVTNRKPLDDLGNPFPILQMKFTSL